MSSRGRACSRSRPTRRRWRWTRRPRGCCATSRPPKATCCPSAPASAGSSPKGEDFVPPATHAPALDRRAGRCSARRVRNQDAAHAEASLGLRATPAARRIARERGVRLSGVRGSGPRGAFRSATSKARAASVRTRVADASIANGLSAGRARRSSSSTAFAPISTAGGRSAAFCPRRAERSRSICRDTASPRSGRRRASRRWSKPRAPS